MNTCTYSWQLLLLFCLLVGCSSSEEKLAEAGYADVSFTASATTGQTRAAEDNGSTLTEGGRATVYVWEGETLSQEDKNAYQNTYTFASKNGVYTLSGSEMQLPTGKTYSFYALSTNSTTQPVPVMATANHTASIQNGVDYLMAVSAKQSINSSDKTTISLAFRHIATRIVLTVKPATKDGYTSAGSLSATIADIDNSGSYIDLSATWDASSPKDMIYWSSGDALVAGGTPKDQVDGGQQKEADQSGADNKVFTVSFIILPVAANQSIPLQFDFTNIQFETGGQEATKRYTARFNVNSSGLKGGYTYTSTVTISRYAATFSGLPQVEPWLVDGIGLDEVIEVDPKPGI